MSASPRSPRRPSCTARVRRGATSRTQSTSSAKRNHGPCKGTASTSTSTPGKVSASPGWKNASSTTNPTLRTRGRSAWISACHSPTTRTAKPATSSSSPSATACTCGPSRPAARSACVHTSSSGRASSAARSAIWSTWSTWSWVTSTASASRSASGSVHAPGSITSRRPALPSDTHACPCLTSSISGPLREAHPQLVRVVLAVEPVAHVEQLARGFAPLRAGPVLDPSEGRRDGLDRPLVHVPHPLARRNLNRHGPQPPQAQIGIEQADHLDVAVRDRTAQLGVGSTLRGPRRRKTAPRLGDEPTEIGELPPHLETRDAAGPSVDDLDPHPASSTRTPSRCAACVTRRASSRSRRDRPPASCEVIRTVTVGKRRSTSGWWSAASASSPIAFTSSSPRANVPVAKVTTAPSSSALHPASDGSARNSAATIRSVIPPKLPATTHLVGGPSEDLAQGAADLLVVRAPHGPVAEPCQAPHEGVRRTHVVRARLGLLLVVVTLVRVAVPEVDERVEGGPREQEQQADPARVALVARRHDLQGRQDVGREGLEHQPPTRKITTASTVPTAWATAEAPSKRVWLIGTEPIVSPVRALTAT